MPRGSLPGERRGGRQRGTPNKKTLLKNAVFLAAASDPTRSPLEFMLALMRDPQVPLDTRIEMAAQTAPFIHARPEPVQKRRPDRLGDPSDLKFGSLDLKPNGSEGGGQSPLDFLLGVMADPAAAPRHRVKSAAIAARYKHPYAAGGEAPSIFVEGDRFGFKVDPELARAERDDRVPESRLKEFKRGSAEAKAAEAELEQIRKRRAERVASVKFPGGYTYLDRRRDENRLGQLYRKRVSRRKLTSEEEAEEAHLAVRVLNPASFEKERRIFDWSDLGNGELLTRTAVLLQRKHDGGALTAAEEEELQTFQRRYPNCLAKLDRDGKGYLAVRVRIA
jgi:hypothetical protein